jgi:uncharacterized protein
VSKHLLLLLAIYSLAISSVHAKTYIRDYIYKASEADSKLTSRVIALDQVKLLLLQEIGTHIRHEINITNKGSGSSYASEDVEAITAGLTKVVIVEEKWNGVTYYLKAKINANTKQVLSAIERFKENKTEKHQELEKLKASQHKLEESRKQIARLKTQLQELNDNEQKHKTIVEYIKVLNQLALDMAQNKLSYYFNKAVESHELGRELEAVDWLRKAANGGHVIAQYNLGMMYLNGEVVKQDRYEAIVLLRMAAEKGYSDAQYNLGYIYFKGLGARQDYLKAFKWFHKAAKHNVSYAQHALGEMYENGLGVKQNYKQALIWYKKAADQGSSEDQIKLGHMYTDGKGVKQDYKQAFAFYSKAADQGHVKAQFILGVMYSLGEGVGLDKVKSKNWFKNACNNKYKDGCDQYIELDKQGY